MKGKLTSWGKVTLDPIREKIDRADDTQTDVQIP